MVFVFYLKVTPNFKASAFASGTNLLKLAILVSSDGCVLINSGGLFPPEAVAILDQNTTDCSGL